MIVRETPRLEIRQLAIDDAPFIQTLLTSPSWMEFIGDRGVKSEADARWYIRDVQHVNYEKYGFGLYLIYEKALQLPIGLCGLLQRDFLDAPDMGFALLDDYAGKGYAREAAEAVLDFAREKGYPRLYAFTIPHNPRSQGLLSRLGFAHTRTMPSPDSLHEFWVFERAL